MVHSWNAPQPTHSLVMATHFWGIQDLRSIDLDYFMDHWISCQQLNVIS